jgi:hypothetical protein
MPDALLLYPESSSSGEETKSRERIQNGWEGMSPEQSSGWRRGEVQRWIRL